MGAQKRIASCPQPLKCLASCPTCPVCTVRSRSGRNIAEAERNTRRVCVRLRPDIAEDLHELAEASGTTIAELVSTWVLRASRGAA